MLAAAGWGGGKGRFWWRLLWFVTVDTVAIRVMMRCHGFIRWR